MPTSLLLLATLATAQAEWTHLPLPSLCQERPAAAAFPALLDGRHLRLDEAFGERKGGVRSALQPSDVGALLRAAAAGGNVGVEVFPFAPPLVVRGTDADLAWARAQVAGLDAAGERSRLAITADLLPTGEDAADAGARWRGTITSGDELAFGPRARVRFVGSYDVEVATDSGLAAPIVGSAYVGKTLHLTAARLEGGRRVHLRGLLDLCELDRIEVLESGTPDNGDFQQPVLRAVQVAFSGVAALGEALTVELEGTPLEHADWTLTITVDGEAEPESLGDGDWRAIDVALLSGLGRTLPAFDPGASLDDQIALEALTPLAQSISASGIASAVESRPRSGLRSSAGEQRAPQHVGESLILCSAARERAEGREALEEFVHALETPRLETVRVELVHDGFRASFPVAGGEPARLLVGVERSLLTGYVAEIANSTWMESPIVETTFDGLAWQGRLSGGVLAESAWIADTTSLEEYRRDDDARGAIQLPRRTVDGASWTEGIGEGSGDEPEPEEASLGIKTSLSEQR